MNNGIFRTYSFHEQDYYCKIFISWGGDYRAPEELHDHGGYIDEKADVYPMGHLIHSLLTGLWPHYHLMKIKEVENATLAGERPYLHPGFRTRSLIERRMTEIMDQCHQHDPTKRVDIFGVVKHLRETKKMHDEARLSIQPSHKQAVAS